MGDALRLDIDRQEAYNRWLPLIKWLLVIPHLFALLVLVLAAIFVWLYALVAVIATGSYPRGAFDYFVGLLRWSNRVTAYIRLMTDAYPPFSLEHDPAYPVRLEVDYPETVERWRPLVAWLLIIPYVLVAHVLNIVASICVLFAFFVILFTKQFPEGLFEMVLVSNRWNARAGAYALFMLTRYPEFKWG